jgi:protein-S-isoprenylcysteine O-methyltransferase Ste14
MKNLFNGPIFIFASIGLIILFFLMLPEDNIIPIPYNLAGLIIALGGFHLMGKARSIFKKYETSLGYEEPSRIVTKGPFQKTRNPMYLGMVLLLLGLAVCFQNIFSLLIPVLFFLYLHFLVIPKEEKKMKDIFGDEYLEYKKQVGRWF